MKPTAAAVKADALLYANENIPDSEFKQELVDQVVDCVLTALNTEKPDSRAFTKRKGAMRVEMRAALHRTPHTTLEDKIHLELYIINNNPDVYLPRNDTASTSV